MINKKGIKLTFLVAFTIFSILGLYLGFRGATTIFSSIDSENVTSSTKIIQPLESKIASYLNILVGIVVFAYIVAFKEKKTNIFWLILGPIGVLAFSIKKLLYLKKGGDNIAI